MIVLVVTACVVGTLLAVMLASSDYLSYIASKEGNEVVMKYDDFERIYPMNTDAWHFLYHIVKYTYNNPNTLESHSVYVRFSYFDWVKAKRLVKKKEKEDAEIKRIDDEKLLMRYFREDIQKYYDNGSDTVRSMIDDLLNKYKEKDGDNNGTASKDA